jgi:hypothetical protein
MRPTTRVSAPKVLNTRLEDRRNQVARAIGKSSQEQNA